MPACAVEPAVRVCFFAGGFFSRLASFAVVYLGTPLAYGITAFTRRLGWGYFGHEGLCASRSTQK